MADQKHNNSMMFEFVILGIIAFLFLFAIGIEIDSVFGSFTFVSFTKAFSCITFFRNISHPALTCDKSIRGKLPQSPIVFLLGICISLFVAGGTAIVVYNRFFNKKGSSVKASEHNKELGKKYLRSKASQIRPDIKFQPQEVGFLIGKTESGRDAWISWEETLYVLGAPRSGKTTGIIIPLIKSVPGAAVITSIRDDLILSTGEIRSKLGDVYVFSQHKDDFFKQHQHLKPLIWNPVIGCENNNIASRRAASLVSAGSGLGNSSENEFWKVTAISILKTYLIAAALGGCTMKDIFEWANDFHSPIPINILEKHGKTTLAAELRSKALDTKLAANNWSGVLTTLQVLGNETIANKVSPSSCDQAIDFHEFIKKQNTIYLAGSETDQELIAPLIALIVEEIVAAARDLVAQQGKRCDPPLALILDEVANIAKIDSITSLLSTGGGSGIFTCIVLQSLNQAKARWGTDRAGTMWEASTAKVVFGGLANASDLRDISALCGTKKVDGKIEPKMTEADIRGIKIGHALLIHRRLEPMKIKLKELKVEKKVH